MLGTAAERLLKGFGARQRYQPRKLLAAFPFGEYLEFT